MNEMFKIIQRTDARSLFNGTEQSEPRQFFGHYLYENELCILFGDSNAGKSILANDITFHVSGGQTYFPNMESPNVPSMYIDMEMSGQQFAKRYASGADLIPDKYSRATVNTLDVEEEMIFPAVKMNIIASQADKAAPKFIVIDNITNGFGSIHSASKMREFISELKSLKARFGLTILLIAHCPKRRQGKPLTQDDLGGSKMIINFADSAFCISTSLSDEGLRYVKQIKCRMGQKKTEVATVRINDEPYLHFEYVSETKEDTHLHPPVRLGVHKSITPEKEAMLVKMLSVPESELPSLKYVAMQLDIPYRAVVQYATTHGL